MRIYNLEAQNFKIFDKMDLNLQGKSTVIFGVNGTGKSTMLSMVNYLFRVWVNRLNPAQGKAYESFSEDVVRIGASKCEISMQVKMDDKAFVLERHYQKNKPGLSKKQQTYDKKLYDMFCANFTERFLKDTDTPDMPIFVNYGTNRSVLDIPLRIRNKHEFSVISALERAIENELDFRTFFEWFRNQEDLENEIKLEVDKNYEDVMLKCVRKAIEAMLGNVTDLKVKRNPLCMKVKKGNKEIRVDHLSDGEKCTLALFGDLARRIAIANQHKENPLEGSGVVLIDEIELHMHPSWQRRVLKVLADTFPNIQFIVTTHSPQVLGEADDRYRIVFLNPADNGCQVGVIKRMDGFDSNYILEEYMGTTSKNEKVKNLIRSINIMIKEREFAEAEGLIELLKEISGDTDYDVILLEGYLRRSRGNR